jgi:hypothetical protein
MLSDATVLAVVPDKDEVRVTYAQGDKITTVAANVVLMCTAKYITSRLVAGLPNEQKQAMRRMRYAPYPMINMIFDKPIYRKGYDNWCPGKTFTDFIVADWTIRNNPGYKPKYNILTFYTPLRESERSTLLEADDCKALAAKALKDFRACSRNSTSTPSKSASTAAATDVHGHPRPIHEEPHDRLKTNGPHLLRQLRFRRPQSLTSEAVRISHAGVEEPTSSAGKPGAADLAHKALSEVLL